MTDADSQPSATSEGDPTAVDGYQRALELLDVCSSKHGFVASPSETANYRRVWGRDGGILCIAALMSGEDRFLEQSRRTLETLAEYQGPHGEIPSNVDPASDSISYGGTAGRVDADLWFSIAVFECWRATEDDALLEKLLPALEKTRFLLSCWEFNNRGLLFVPPTGDWADEYVQSGYVLYDQLLYYCVHRGAGLIHEAVHGSKDHALIERTERLKHLIQSNYWFDGETSVDDAYHPVLYERGRDACKGRQARHWMPSFSPTGYSYRFDAFANILASLLGVAGDEQREQVDAHLDRISPLELPLVPAFQPVIKPVDEDWKDLHVTFSYSFKNEPYEYHNGGLWPLLTGFYAADLAARGEGEEAERRLGALDRANSMEMDGEPWSFPEYVHGKELTPGGTRHQGWSAAAAVIGRQALAGRRPFHFEG